MNIIEKTSASLTEGRERKIHLVCIAGLGGAIGTTLATALSLGSREVPSIDYGMATESVLVKKLGIEFPRLDSYLIDGWDFADADLYQTSLRQGICPPRMVEAAKDSLSNIKPRQPVTPEADLRGWITEEARRIRKILESEGMGGATIVNLCPTETTDTKANKYVDWPGMTNLHIHRSTIYPSQIYLRLAIEAKVNFINYTPNKCFEHGLMDLAIDSGIVFCGNDGKTGQTFLKTVLSPAFRDKNLRINGWFSVNLLGNNDGKVLAESGALKTKVASKKKCLESIVEPAHGEDLEHQVHIHYYPPRGDAKEAWDNIDFSGFMGARMQMKINWLGQDSILAAPAVIDLLRIVDLAEKSGKRGLLQETAYFFKDPLVVENSPGHSTPDQFNVLLDFLKELRDEEFQAKIRLDIDNLPQGNLTEHYQEEGPQEFSAGGDPRQGLKWPEWPIIDEHTIGMAVDVLRSGNWTISALNAAQESFERKFADAFASFHGVPFCVPTASGSSALKISLAALGIGPGDEVLVPGLTWVACASSVLELGATPVLVDIEGETLCMSPQEARNAISNRTKAIILVHQYCSIANLDEFSKISLDLGIPLIEDCSQSHGAEISGRRVGTWGKMGVFSMQQSKVLTCGEGGAVITSDENIYNRLQELRADGRRYSPSGLAEYSLLEEVGSVQGVNHCLSEVHSAILLGNLDRLDEENFVRERNAELLRDALSQIPGIILPAINPKASRVTYYKFCFLVEPKLFGHDEVDALGATLGGKTNLNVLPVIEPLDSHPLYRPDLSRRLGRVIHHPGNPQLPVAHHIRRSGLTIPHQALLGTPRQMRFFANELSKLRIPDQSGNV